MRRRPARVRPTAEVLEPRDVPSAVTVQADHVVRTLNEQSFGVNLNSYDGVLTADHDNPATATPDPGSVDLLKASGVKLVRLSNGSGSDEWHFDREGGGLNFASGAGVMANAAAAVGADAIVTVNFGTGSPQEAAAYLAYLNDSPIDDLPIGTDATGRDRGAAGFWAGLRGQAPLARDDGLNHLRAGHPAPYGFHYFEVGNEAYFGAWQGGAMPDPGQYARFAAAFAGLAQKIGPGDRVGIGVGNPAEWDELWNGPVLDAARAIGFTPAFLSDHFYVFDGVRYDANGVPHTLETMTDADLLNHTVTDPNSVMPIHADPPRNWSQRA